MGLKKIAGIEIKNREQEDDFMRQPDYYKLCKTTAHSTIYLFMCPTEGISHSNHNTTNKTPLITKLMNSI